MSTSDWSPWIDRLQRLLSTRLEPALRRFIHDLAYHPTVRQALANAGVRPAWLEEALGLVPNLVVLIGGLMTDPDVPPRTRALFLASLAYVALPFDLLPDRIPGFGQLDDLLILTLGLHMLLNETNQVVVTGHWRGSIESLRLIQIAVRSLAVRIPAPVLENVRRWAV